MKRKYNVAKKSLGHWQALADKIVISKHFYLGFSEFFPKRREVIGSSSLMVIPPPSVPQPPVLTLPR